jgi:hypothetical protein
MLCSILQSYLLLAISPAEQAGPKDDVQPLLENRLCGATATANLEARATLFASGGTKPACAAAKPSSVGAWPRAA